MASGAVDRRPSNRVRARVIALRNIRESLCLATGNMLPRSRISDRLRSRLYRLAGMRIETPCRMWGPVTVRPIGSASNIRIGRGTFINTDTRFAASGGITIGRDVAIGPRVCLETVDHGLVHMPGQGRGSVASPIAIGDRVWLGAGVIVAPGVTIGHDSVIAAGAVVVRDVEPWSLYGGVPAKRMRTIDPATEKAIDVLPEK
jgi:maltose O-acetyltransferase